MIIPYLEIAIANPWWPPDFSFWDDSLDEAVKCVAPVPEPLAAGGAMYARYYYGHRSLVAPADIEDFYRRDTDYVAQFTMECAHARPIELIK